MRYVETSGKTVDDAITAALLELGLPSEQVDIEILQESSKGVLGIFGAKEARIRATAKAVPVEEELFSEKAEEPVKEEAKPVQQEKAQQETEMEGIREIRGIARQRMPA